MKKLFIILSIISIGLNAQLIENTPPFNEYSYCFEGDGTNNYFKTSAVTGTYNTIILEFWLNAEITSITPTNTFGSIGGTQGNIVFGSISGLYTNETFSIYRNATSDGVYIKDNIPAGYNMITCVWNGSYYDIYLNGVSKTTFNNGSAHFTNGIVHVGAREANLTQKYTGKINGFSLYSQSLTPTEILNRYNNSVRPYTPLVDLPPVEGYNDKIYDVSGNGYHSTALGSNYWSFCINNYIELFGFTKVIYLGNTVLVPFLLSGSSLYPDVAPVLNIAETALTRPVSYYTRKLLVKSVNKLIKQ